MKYINTDNLTAINYGDGEIKLMIFNKHKSPYGYSPRDLVVSLFSVSTKRIYVQLCTTRSRQSVFYF